jgi:hypothetical protein
MRLISWTLQSGSEQLQMEEGGRSIVTDGGGYVNPLLQMEKGM